VPAGSGAGAHGEEVDAAGRKACPVGTDELANFLAAYADACGQAGVEPLPIADLAALIDATTNKSRRSGACVGVGSVTVCTGRALNDDSEAGGGASSPM